MPPIEADDTQSDPSWDVPVTVVFNVKVIAATSAAATAVVGGMTSADLLARGDIVSVTPGTPAQV